MGWAHELITGPALLTCRVLNHYQQPLYVPQVSKIDDDQIQGWDGTIDVGY